MTPSRRIVSLLPSATEIVAALGLTADLVGRSHECDYPAAIAHLPVCTAARLNAKQPSRAIDTDVQTLVQAALSLYEIKLDVLQASQPTHIVTQAQCDVCAVTVAEVEQAVAQLTQPHPQIISLQPNTLSEVWADIERVGAAFGVDAQPLLQQLHQRLATCSQSVPTSQLPTVATLEWLDPLMGGGNWVPELVTLAGGHNLFGQTGQHSPYLSWEQLLAADPDVVIVMPCGFDLARTRQELQQAVQHSPHWQHLRAVQQQQLYLTDGNAYCNRPGPRLVDSLEILAEILHPHTVAPRYLGQGWEPFVLS